MKMKIARKVGGKKLAVKDSLAKAHGSRCVYCKKYFRNLQKLTLDHVIPKSKGGSDKRANLVLACSRCNQKKANKDADLFKRHMNRQKTFC